MQVCAVFEQDYPSLRGSVSHLLVSDMEAESDMDDDVSSALLSPSGQSDAQTLALMLQEQLDAINEEIRYPSHKRSRRIRAHDSFIISAAGNESVQQRAAERRMKGLLSITGSVTNNQTEGRDVEKDSAVNTGRSC